MHSATIQDPQAIEGRQQIIDRRELALRMGKSERYIAHLVERRLIPFIRLPGRAEPRLHRVQFNGTTIERPGRAGQLMFCWDKVVEALMKYEVRPEEQPAYRMRRRKALGGGE